MKLLFIDSCIRGPKSRTKILCDHFINKFTAKNPDWQIERVSINDLEIEAFDLKSLEERNELLAKKDFSDKSFDLAKQLMESDQIVLGAPYWDLSFPAKLKAYLEQCSVTGLTYIYNEMGIPEGQCRAKALTYITTSGGPIGDMNYGYDYIKGLCKLFGIEKTYFASAEMLDVIGVDVQQAIEDAKVKITEIVEAL
ncbi:MAG: NAD(P)H-dependent oxidoreductase [Firmicutes bacterium]|nr:NAD(P)H-dependent oxidoreductase [Bacillota bacterium]